MRRTTKYVIEVIFFVVLMFTLSGCSNDKLRVKTKRNKEFAVIRVKDDYYELPQASNLVYTENGVDYPQLKDGEIAYVVADVNIYYGGVAGYTDNIFIKDIKSYSVIDHEEAAEKLNIPDANDSDFKYGSHILQYKDENDLYLIMISRNLVVVYRDLEPFMEYEAGGTYENELIPFFEKISDGKK